MRPRASTELVQLTRLLFRLCGEGREPFFLRHFHLMNRTHRDTVNKVNIVNILNIVNIVNKVNIVNIVNKVNI